MENEEKTDLSFVPMTELIDEIKKRVPTMVLIYSDFKKIGDAIKVTMETKWEWRTCEYLMEFFDASKIQEVFQKTHEKENEEDS